nr:lipocalin family protein [uncultured Carboxylicivirga sp.]
MKNNLIFALLLLLTMCKSNEELPTVAEVNLERYMGTWYEIARLPNSFEKGLECVTATYSIKDDGFIKVVNKGFSESDHSKTEEAIGKAKIPDTNYPGQLKVSFFGPFYGNYYIIDLDPNYQYVLIGEPSRKYLWILSRTPELNSSIYNSLISKAQELGFATNKISITNQECNQ